MPINKGPDRQLVEELQLTAATYSTAQHYTRMSQTCDKAADALTRLLNERDTLQEECAIAADQYEGASHAYMVECAAHAKTKAERDTLKNPITNLINDYNALLREAKS